LDKTMKKTALLTLLVALTGTLAAGSVMAGQMPDSSGSGSYVKEISINASKPYPVFVVKSDGKTYTQVDNDGTMKTFHARVGGKCTNIAHVDGANYNLNKTKYNGGNVATRQLPVAGKWHKTFGHNVAVDIQWKPDSSVRSKALKACQHYMQQARQNGQSLFQILGKDHRLTVDSGVYGAFHLSCTGNLTIAGGVKHRFDMQPIEVVCKGSPVAMNVDLDKLKLFKVTQLVFHPNAPSYTGLCPKDFGFAGYVRTNGEQGKFRYRFKNESGSSGPWKTVQASKGNTQYPLHYSVKLQDIHVNPHPTLPGQIQNQGQQGGMAPKPQLGMKQNPWVTVEVENLANHKRYSRKASYKYTCTQPPKMQLGTLNGGSKQPDLIVLGSTFQLGSKVAGPDHALAIGADEANGKVAGLCRFRMQFKIKNQGQATAAPLFTTRVADGNKALFFAQTPSLNKGMTRTLSGNIKLGPGNHLLLIKTDHANKVAESNEGNNLARIRVTVRGPCGSSTPTRPRDPGGAPTRPAR